MISSATVIEQWLRRTAAGTDRAEDIVVCAAGDDVMAGLVEQVGRAARRIRSGRPPMLLAPESDGVALPPGWARAPLAEVDDWIRLESPVHDGGVLVPRLCLRRTVWITIASLAAHPGFGFCTPFTVHLDILARANRNLAWPLLACDVYRLWQPDLAVACLPVAAAGAGSTPMALVDVRVDRLEVALASLAGVKASDLPHWREVAKRFPAAGAASSLLPPTVDEPLLTLDLAAARAGAARALRAHANRQRIEDLRRSVTNLRRAPDFLRRRFQVSRGWLA